MRGLVAYALFLPLAPAPSLCGQVPQPKHHAVSSAALPHSIAPTSPHELKVTHVSLYKNGVGFFEHEGSITGDASVSLDLTSAQLNDVLQSLTATDLGGGHVTGANYNSTTPLEQQLRTLPLSLGEQPSQEDLFNALRGARVEVSGSGATFTGRLLSLEIRTPAPNADDKPTPERRFLTVIADNGSTRTLELGPNTVVHLLDANLRGDLNTYLELLDRNRTEGIRHLVLTDRGSGSRMLHVSFLSEVPVWKSTYRLLLTTSAGGSSATQKTAAMQGFSVVDNTTGEDWNNVQLSLIAGSPQSFLQPISQPIYDRRPEVPIAANAQTTPQTHESAEGTEPPPGSASADLGSGVGGNAASLFGSPTGTGTSTGGPVVSATKGRARISGGVGGSMNMLLDSAPPPSPTMVPHAAAASPEEFEELTRSSTIANATTSSFDDFFAYNLTDPVTIPRNGSALVPILQARLPVETVTLWSAHQSRPLRALWLTNNSDLTLDRGSFSVVENGAFAGEGLIDPVHPGERRLLSYAVDQAVRVSTTTLPDLRRVTRITVAKGVLTATRTEVNGAEFTVSNAAPEARTVVLEAARLRDWKLDTATKPTETTPDTYRFRLEVQPHAAAHLSVRQSHIFDQYFRLADTSQDQLATYLQDNEADPQLLHQLEPVFAAKRKVADLDAQINALRTRERTIGEDQKRLRDNLAALKGSAEERSLVRRYTLELNTQEDALNDLHRQLAALQDQRTAAAADLSHQIESLQITETTPAQAPTTAP